MNIMMTGGGTGGHVIPCLALVPDLKKKGANIQYIGSHSSIEERLVKESDIPFYSVTTVKLRRDRLLSNLKIPYLLMKGVKEAKQILKDESIDIVFSKGGYVSLPACLAAKRLDIPVVTHESDSTLGVANRIISRFANLVITNNDDIKCKAKTLNLGNPVRYSIFNGNKYAPLVDMHYIPRREFLLVLGGSTGAKAINDFIYDNIDELTKHYNILHITGKSGKNISHMSYKAIEYTQHIEDYYALADVVIARSGAGVLSELLALKKRMLLVPLSNKSSRGDQVINAERVARKGLAEVISEKSLSIDLVLRLLENTKTLNLDNGYISKNTNKKIVDAIYKVYENALKK